VAGAGATTFRKTPFWKAARARLVVEIVALPRSLVEAFGRTDDSYRDWVKRLRFLSPLTVSASPIIKIS
jgi:hypothetical protein